MRKIAGRQRNNKPRQQAAVLHRIGFRVAFYTQRSAAMPYFLD